MLQNQNQNINNNNNYNIDKEDNKFEKVKSPQQNSNYRFVINNNSMKTSESVPCYIKNDNKHARGRTESQNNNKQQSYVDSIKIKSHIKGIYIYI